MVWWVTLIYYAAIFILSELLRPKPPDAKAVAFEDYGFPSVDPNRRIPVIWGNVRIDSPHTIDVLTYRTRRIRARAGLFTRVTTGHKYFVSIALGIARNGCTLRKIYFDDQLVWSGSMAPSANGTTGTILDGDFYGGSGQGGGISGSFTYHAGGSAQNTPALMAQYQSPTPGYRHVSMVIFNDFYFGNTGSMPRISFELERYPNTLGIGAARFIVTSPDESPNVPDLAVPEIIHEVLTDLDWGLGVSSVNDIRTASFTAAAATLVDEANGMSLKWMRGDNMEEIIRTCLAQIDGMLYRDPTDGKWTMKLARPDYLTSPLTVMDVDDNNSQLIRFNRSAWDETYNTVHVTHTDRASREAPSPAVEFDTANFEIVGTHEVLTVPYPGCYSRTLAQNLAAREIHQASFPLVQVELDVQRGAYDLNPGDVFRWSNDALGVTQMFMRIVKMSLGTLEIGKIRLVAYQDIFGVGYTLFDNPQPRAYVPKGGAATAIATGHAFEQPYFLNRLDPDTLTPGGTHRPLLLMKAPQNNALTYDVYSRTGSSSYTQEDVDGDYVPVAQLVDAMNEASSPWDMPGAILVNNASRLSAIAVATLSQRQEGGANLAVIYSVTSPLQREEYISFESLTDNGDGTYTLNHVQRGVMDTLPKSWPAGTNVWFLDDGIPPTTIDDYTAAQTVDFKLYTRTGTDLAATAFDASVTFANRVNRPLAPANFRIASSGESPQIARRYPTAGYAAGDMLFTWNRHDLADNVVDFQQDGDDGALAGIEYVIEIYDTVGSPIARGSLLRTLTTSSNAISYTAAQQAADSSPLPTHYWIEAYARKTASPGGYTSLETVMRVVQWG